MSSRQLLVQGAMFTMLFINNSHVALWTSLSPIVSVSDFSFHELPDCLFLRHPTSTVTLDRSTIRHCTNIGTKEPTSCGICLSFVAKTDGSATQY